MSKSTSSRGHRKAAKEPTKPRPDFPLFPHATGRWAKKIKGRLHYFGKVADDPKGEAALQRYLDDRDDLYAGRTPRSKRVGLTIEELANRFCAAKDAKVQSGELAPATLRDYIGTCKRIVKHFGRARLVEDLRGDDFDKFRADLAKTNGLVGLCNQITQARMVFNYAYKAGLIERPVHFGANFSRPSKKAIRKQRTPRMFEAAEIRQMIDRARPVMKAMILLGVNAGFGCSDVGRLPKEAVDLEDGWITFPRPKTGSDRRVPLWPETIAAIREAIAVCPKPASKDLSDRVFLTRNGQSWFKESTRYMTEQFRKFLQGIDDQAADKALADGVDAPPKLYRKGRGFYTLRHVFETMAGESCDQVAVDAIMGRERGDMASHYRERISDERLRKVVNTVRDWLYAVTACDDGDGDEVPAAVPFRVVG
jgi:integrase